MYSVGYTVQVFLDFSDEVAFTNRLAQSIRRCTIISDVKIVVVDKDKLVREFTVDVLEFCINREVASFGSSKKAWEHIKNNGNAHIIIAEADLPEMTGFDLLEKIKNSYPEKTCIIMSQSHTDEKRADELGANAFLAKPFYVDEIFELVQRYVIQK